MKIKPDQFLGGKKDFFYAFLLKKEKKIFLVEDDHHLSSYRSFTIYFFIELSWT